MIEQLLERYRHGCSTSYSDYLLNFDAIKIAQMPLAAIISCCDSRMEPSRLFSLDPGEVFSIRNIANLVPDYSTLATPSETAAGLAFAVLQLQVLHLVVLGHGNCPGIQRMMSLPDSGSDDGFVDRWVRQAKPARYLLTHEQRLDSKKEQSKLCEQASIRLSLDRLMGYPWIRKRVNAGRLALHGWYYSFCNGQLLCLDPDSQCFDPIERISHELSAEAMVIGKS